MADQTFGIEFVVTKTGDGDVTTKQGLDNVKVSADQAAASLNDAGAAAGNIGGSGAGAAAESIKKVGDAAAGAAAGADEAGKKTLTLNDLLGTLGSRSGFAREMLTGIEATLNGNSTAAFQAARGFQGLVQSLSGGELGIFALGITGVIALLRILPAALSDSQEKVNALGESAKTEKTHLDDLAAVKLNFDNAKAGLDELKGNFDRTESAIATMSKALENLDKVRTSAALGQVTNQTNAEIEAANGDPALIAAAKQRGQQATEDINAQAAINTGKKAIADTTGQIQRTTEQIQKLKEGEDDVDSQALESGKRYAAALAALAKAHIDPADLDTEKIGELVKQYKDKLSMLIKGPALGDIGGGGALAGTAEQQQQDTADTRATIDALQNISRIRADWEKIVDDTRTTQKKTDDDIKAYNEKIESLTVDLQAKKEELVKVLADWKTKLQSMLPQAQAGLASSQQNEFQAEASGADPALTQAFAAETQKSQAEVTTVKQLLDDVNKQLTDALQAVVDSATKAGPDVKASSDAAVTIIQGSATDAKTVIAGAAGDMKGATDELTNTVKEGHGTLIDGVQKLNDAYVSGLQVMTNKTQVCFGDVQAQIDLIHVTLGNVVAAQAQVQTQVEVVKAQVDNMQQ